jgi:hypothetical protein
MKIRPLGSRVFPFGRTDMRILVVAFRNFANAPKKKNRQLFVLVENAQRSVACNLFPFTFYSSTFYTYLPCFPRQSFSFSCAIISFNSPPTHVSTCLMLRPLYSLLSKIISIINLRHQRFINHLSYHGRSVSCSMTRKYNFSESSDGEFLIHRDLSEQMSGTIKSDATSVLTDNIFKHPGKHRWMNGLNIQSNLAEISCRDECTTEALDKFHCDGCNGT